MSARPERSLPDPCRTRLSRLWLVIGLSWWMQAVVVDAADERYFAVFRDGSVALDNELKEWNDPGAQPKLAGRALFDATNPALWIVDRQAEPVASPPLAIEFFGGDRLAGEVVGYRAGGESAFESLPPHVMVRPVSETDPPDDLQADGLIRVTLDSVRRIVWERRSDERYRPATAFFRNGAEWSFRSVRWSDGTLSFLTEQGIRTAPWSDLAEVHLPAQDPWQVYAQTLAVIAPELNERVGTCETGTGDRLTFSTARMQARHWGDRNRLDAWFHLLQPAWALDPLWIRVREIQSWQSYAPEEPPLTWADPQTVTREAVFSQTWQWQPHRTTTGLRLRAGDRTYATGYGVHASTDLSIPVPASAKALRTWFALDPSVGKGGCVHAAILLGGTTLMERKQLIGGHDPVDTGWLPLGGMGPRTVVLRVDMAKDARPNKVDPFDIRDVANWCSPLLQLDPAALREAVQSYVRTPLHGLAGWTIPAIDTTPLRTRPTFDGTDPRDGRFRTLLRTADRFLVASRKFKIENDQRYLSVVVSRFERDTQPSTVQIKVDGVSAGEFDVPVRQGPIDPDPVIVSVEKYRGRTVTVEVVAYSPQETSWIEFRGAALTAERPGIARLFEDEAELARQLQAEPQQELLTNEKPYSGMQSLQIHQGFASAPQTWERGASVVEWPKLGQFRYLVFAWQGTGDWLTLQLAHDGRFGSEIAEGRGIRLPNPKARFIFRKVEDRGLRYGFAYDIGPRKTGDLPPLRLDRNVPKDWRAETRDLFGDFGAMALTGFAIGTGEQGTGRFDHLYLARTPQDLDVLRTLRVNSATPAVNNDPTYLQRAATPADWGPMVGSFAPAFAMTEAAHGLYQLREHMGQSEGWQTHPHDQNRPFVLRTGMHFPADAPKKLTLRVSHAPEKDWQLVVKANGTPIHQQLINAELTRPQRGWALITVDLSSLQGRKVLLEVLNQSNDWQSEYAYWKQIAIEDL